ncbi:MAG: biotin transporter BioY [Dehalococcoidales bacterium]|nr:biotin transporter BioY [Dehalococcoidales bacterium]
MQITSAIERTRYNVFKWRYNLSIPRKLIMAFGMAGLTGLLAQVRILTELSPVPITGQTLAVLLAGVLLGRRWGGASMAIYAILGVAGIPWFNGWTSGLGVTGGYFIGFILAALFLGYFTDKYIKSRYFFSMLGLMIFASMVLVYVPGVIWLGLWLNMVTGTAVSISALLAMGVVPFIIGDVIKVILAAGITRMVTPKTNYADNYIP